MFPNGAKNAVDPDSVLRRVILPALEVCEHCSKPEAEHGKANHKYERNKVLPQWYGWHAFRRELATNLNRLGGCGLDSTYVRGQAYLAAGNGMAAANEFQKILDHSGIVLNNWTGALARLGLARANALQAKKSSTGYDADLARTRAVAAYKNFLTFWKEADPDIPILKQAKAEYTKLQ